MKSIREHFTAFRYKDYRIINDEYRYMKCKKCGQLVVENEELMKDHFKLCKKFNANRKAFFPVFDIVTK